MRAEEALDFEDFMFTEEVDWFYMLLATAANELERRLPTVPDKTRSWEFLVEF